MKQIWLRDPQAFQVIVMSYQSYVGLKNQPGFEQLAYVPFGIAETSPLVAFDWTTTWLLHSLWVLPIKASPPAMAWFYIMLVLLGGQRRLGMLIIIKMHWG
ncbi:hypothetical protein PN498_14310 [Oscillatoria sp. CS-180]|uniref:hypothetical protein n=1 Tax=Oscillatoria sp. CS-180 TaxID=3021720 RepID=UPI00232B24D2|nr:hypothetical protein [Oscillatoria sp. CS-180]MDB9527171.1 hypothetical protein [Oscillatoria sp. CS-180]